MDGEGRDIRPNEARDYFETARDWEACRDLLLASSERRAWRVAVGACIVAVLSICGLIALLPLKRTVPYVFAVHQTTGQTEVVEAANDRAMVGYQDLLDKHWAQRYVLARESYVYKLLQTDYDKTLALSTDAVGRVYAAQYEGAQARDKKLGTSTEIRVQILSISLAPDAISPKAVVRFETRTFHTDSGAALPAQTYVATLAYEYRPSMLGKEKDLIENPLGYRVTSYRVDAELNPASSAAPITVAASGHP